MNKQTVMPVVSPSVAGKQGKKALLKAPEKKQNAFTAFVAAQKAAVVSKEERGAVAQKAQPVTVVAEPIVAPAAAPAFVHTEQNGRKDYAPGTIGRRIWDTADVLQAVTPNTALKSEAVRLALPDVCPGSVSSGLTHWRQFHGTVRVKGMGGKKTRKVALANAVPVVIEVMGPPVPPWMKSTALV